MLHPHPSLSQEKDRARTLLRVMRAGHFLLGFPQDAVDQHLLVGVKVQQVLGQAFRLRISLLGLFALCVWCAVRVARVDAASGVMMTTSSPCLALARAASATNVASWSAAMSSCEKESQWH